MSASFAYICSLCTMLKQLAKQGFTNDKNPWIAKNIMVKSQAMRMALFSANAFLRHSPHFQANHKRTWSRPGYCGREELIEQPPLSERTTQTLQPLLQKKSRPHNPEAKHGFFGEREMWYKGSKEVIECTQRCTCINAWLLSSVMSLLVSGVTFIGRLSLAIMHKLIFDTWGSPFSLLIWSRRSAHSSQMGCIGIVFIEWPSSKLLTKLSGSLDVAAHLRGMRPTPSTKKDTLMFREKLKL